MRAIQLLSVLSLLLGAPTLAACAETQGSNVQAVSVAESVQEEDLVGRWSGTLDVQVTTLRLELVIERDDQGLSGQLISIDQGGAVIDLAEVVLEEATLRFTDPPRGVVYEGQFTTEGTIDGTFRQGLGRFSLVFARGGFESDSDEAEPAPQDTLVAVSDPETGRIHQLAGTLTRPEGGARAAVVILSGSGSQDRDGTIAGQRLYKAWADLLADEGVASLRLDDRGVGGSDPVIPSSPDDLALDAAAALNVLRLETGVQCVGYVGHSEGGWVGLLAAPAAEADFVLSMAGMHETMETTLIRQSEAIILSSGGNQTAVAANRRLQEAVFSVLRVATPQDDIAGQIEAALLEVGAPAALAANQAAIWGQPYAAASFQMDPRDAAAAYDGQVLALFGQTDTQVLAGSNAQALIDSRPNAPTRTVTVEGVDHLFQLNESGAPAAYGEAGHAIAPGAAEVLVEETRLLLDQACGG